MMFGSSAHAEGSFKLNIEGTTPQVLDLVESGGDYLGTLTTNGTPVEVSTSKSGNSTTFYIGNDVSHLSVVEVDGTTTYSGNFGNRQVTINAESKGAKLVYDGSIGAIDDITGKSNSGKDRLVLYWGKNKLRISDGPSSGTCAGTLESAAGSVKISCETTGDLYNAVFDRPELTVFWIMQLLVK